MQALVPILFLVVFVLDAAAYNPNQPQGFGVERSYHEAPGLPDQVDLFSGRLSVAIPIGPFQLVYNNNVWRYSTVDEGGVPKVQALPDRLQNAGLGWHLGWGELYNPEHWYNNTDGQWLYVSDNGSRHTFYGSLHRGEDDGDLNVYYTRDGSYLRLRKIVPGSTWDIEFPDGTSRRFVKAGPGSPYRLTKLWSPFGSASDPDTTITYDADDKLRTVTDRYGRVTKVHLAGDDDLVDGHPLAFMVRVVTKVEVPTVGTGTATYDFSYRNIDVNLSCKNESGAFGSRVRLPHLVQISMPDGETAYTMEQGGKPSYVNTCGGPGQADDIPGSLTRLQLPTGGALHYAYQEYEFPPGETWGPFSTSTGVKTRTAIDLDGTVIGSWHYVSRGFGAPPLERPEMRTDVVSFPEGDCVRHYFDATYWFSPQQNIGWQYGLPFVNRVQNNGRFLSREVFTGHQAATKLCNDNTKIQSHYVRFRRDPIPGASPVPSDPTCSQTANCSRVDEWFNTNRTVQATRTVFHDDEDRWVDSERNLFDGIGNFRQTVTTANLWSDSSNSERRESLTNYNRVTGTLPDTTYTPPSPADPWVLGIFDSVEVAEDDSQGETRSRVEYAFDDTTGAIQCTRSLGTGTTRDSGDLITTFDRNARGLVTDVKRYGGDASPLPLGDLDPCGTLPAQPVYWERNSYSHGVLESTRPMDPSGAAGPFLTYDADIDPATGLVIAQRDSAGIEMTLAYDSAGRPMSITPPANQAPTLFSYTAPTMTASGGIGARISTTTELAGIVYSETEVILDGFGRQKTQRRKMPGGSLSSQTITRNVRGWPLSISQWGNVSGATQLSDYDPFGRPGKVVPPEGDDQARIYTYTGGRAVAEHRTVQTVLQAGTETTVTRTRELDGYGRLRKLTEGDGTTTTYAYDVGNRLTDVSTVSGLVTQSRRYKYDNLGFLRSERHPEKGFGGDGFVYYEKYDPAGNAHVKVDGPHNLGYTYDFAGRLTKVRDLGDAAERPLRNFYYDTAVGAGNGKLAQAVAHNYLTLPWGTGEVDVRVAQAYKYNGVGGSLNIKDTVTYWPDGSDHFRTRLGRNAGSNLTSITYPRCVTGSCNSTPAGNSETITQGYQYGLLTEVSGWAPSISYHSGGRWSQINHSNAVSDLQSFTSLRSDRPESIRTSGAASPFDTGTFAFDGSGNIKSMGGNHFAYDPLGRLKTALLPNMATTDGYRYDAFGNLLERTSSYSQVATQYSVDSETNRLGDASYDGAGNVLSWQGKVFEYNKFDRLTRQAWMQYLYDAHGERTVSLVNTGGLGRSIRYHLRGLNHELLSTIYSDGSVYSRELDTVYRDGRLLGAKDGDGNRRHYHLDHLGTPRLITKAGGAVLSQPAVLPYGMDLLGDTVDNRKLTGHERDFSTGTDYMHARQYSAQMGRFLSVDPLRGNPAMPQSLNRNAYVMGNPLRYADPTGRQVVPDNNTGPSGSFDDEITVTGSLPGYLNLPFSNLPIPGWGGTRGPTTGGGSGGGGRGPTPVDGPVEEPNEPTTEVEEPNDPCAAKISPTFTVGAGGGAGVAAAGSYTFLGPDSPHTLSGILGVGAYIPAEAGFGFGASLTRGVQSTWGTGMFASANLITPFVLGPGFSFEVIQGDNGAASVSLHFTVGAPHGGVVMGRTLTGSYKHGKRLKPVPCN